MKVLDEVPRKITEARWVSEARVGEESKIENEKQAMTGQRDMGVAQGLMAGGGAGKGSASAGLVRPNLAYTGRTEPAPTGRPGSRTPRDVPWVMAGSVKPGNADLDQEGHGACLGRPSDAHRTTR